MLETLDYTIRIGSTPTILYFDIYMFMVILYAFYKSGAEYREFSSYRDRAAAEFPRVHAITCELIIKSNLSLL